MSWRTVRAMGLLLEGYYVEDVYGDIYAVKGVVQPPGRVYAVPKLVRVGSRYWRPATLQDGLSYVMDRRPGYMFEDRHSGRIQPTVPFHMVARVIRPSLQPSPNTPAVLRDRALRLADLILKGCGQDGELGLTGSFLLGHARQDSDIDFVAYGMRFGRSLYKLMSGLREEGITRALDTSSAKLLLASRRDTAMASVILGRNDCRKVLTGLFEGSLYMVKIVPWPWEYWEEWGSTACRHLGRAKIVAEITDDSLGIFTPSLYQVRALEAPLRAVGVDSIYSFRSRFAEHCRKGEVVEAYGTLEEVYSNGFRHLRLSVGWSPDDYVVGRT